MQAPYSESTITPEAILNITPSPATTVQTLLNSQPSIYATTGATNGMETNIKFRAFSDGEVRRNGLFPELPWVHHCVEYG